MEEREAVMKAKNYYLDKPELEIFKVREVQCRGGVTKQNIVFTRLEKVCIGHKSK